MLCLDSLSTNLISPLFARLYLFGFVNTHVSPSLSLSPSALPAYWSLLMDWLWFRRRLTCFPILLFSPGEINEERPANLDKIGFWGIYSEARPTGVSERVCDTVKKCEIGLTETIWCFKLNVLYCVLGNTQSALLNMTMAVTSFLFTKWWADHTLSLSHTKHLFSVSPQYDTNVTRRNGQEECVDLLCSLDLHLLCNKISWWMPKNAHPKFTLAEDGRRRRRRSWILTP